MTARDAEYARRKPILCVQCGAPVSPEREEWDVPYCAACLPPLGEKRAEQLLAMGRMVVLALIMCGSQPEVA